MLNVKTCEDSFLKQASWSTTKQTHVSYQSPTDSRQQVAFKPRLTPPHPPIRPGQKLSLKIYFKNCPKRRPRLCTGRKFLKSFFQIYFIMSAISVKVVLSLSGWMVLLLLLLLFLLTTVYWQHVKNLGHAPWQLTCLPCYCFCLYTSGKIFRKAISVWFESPFVIGLPYSTVI